MAKQINSSLIEIVKVNELPDLALAVQNYFAHCGINGVLGKSDINSLAIFLAPYITAIGGSGFLATTGTALPAASAGKYTIVGVGTFTQATGGSITTTQPINILASNASTWSLAVAIPIDLSSYVPKSNKVLIPVNATYVDSVYDTAGVLVVRTGFNAKLFPYTSGRFYHSSTVTTSPTNYISFFTAAKAFISSIALGLNQTYTENDITALIPANTGFIGVNGNSANTLVAFNSVFDYANRTDLAGLVAKTEFEPVKTNVDYLVSKLNAYKDSYGLIRNLTLVTAANNSFINLEPITRAGLVDDLSVKINSTAPATGGTITIEQWRSNIVQKSVVVSIVPGILNNFTALGFDVLAGDYIGVKGQYINYGTVTGKSFATTTPGGTVTANSAIDYSFLVKVSGAIEVNTANVNTLLGLVKNGYVFKNGDISLAYQDSTALASVFANLPASPNLGVVSNFKLKVLAAAAGNSVEISVIRLISGKYTKMASYVSTAVANETNIFNPNLTVKPGDLISLNCVGVTFSYSNARAATTGKSFVTINLSTGNVVTSANSWIAYEYEVTSKSIKEITDGLVVVKNPALLLTPTVIYTECNDVITGGNPALVDYKADVYLDSFLNNITSEPKIKFKGGLDRLSFVSPKKIVGTTFTANEGVNVLTAIKTVTVEGDEINDFSFDVKHISTKASVGANSLPRILDIRDSTGVGLGAVRQGDPQMYPLTAQGKMLFEMKRLDNGGTGHNAIFVGTKVNVITTTYKGQALTYRAGYEAISGVSTSFWLSSGATNPFWDGTKWSMKYYLDNWRTMTDAGVRLVWGDPAIGSKITQTSLQNIDVCLPTHISLGTALNDTDNPTTYVTNINNWINLIKTEYSNQGWFAPFIAVAPINCAGTYFPSLHPKFGQSAAIWNSPLSRHDKMYRFVKAWMEYTKTWVEDDLRVYFLNTYFVTPSAEGLPVRNTPNFQWPGGLVNEKFEGVEKFANEPEVHVSIEAHSAFAQQLEGWVMYTIGKTA